MSQYVALVFNYLHRCLKMIIEFILSARNKYFNMSKCN